MAPIYKALGLTVGVIQNNTVSYLYEPGFKPGEEGSTGGLDDLRPCSRREAYRADITYGTNNEFGFDYLRDNMVRDLPKSPAPAATSRSSTKSTTSSSTKRARR